MNGRGLLALAHCLNAQLVEHSNEPLVKTLVGADGLGEGHQFNIVVPVAYHHVALTLLDGLDSSIAHTAGKDAVACRGAAASLQVSQYGDAHIEPGELMFHAVSIVEGAALGTL